jgi:thiamine-phosphate pyrophosphorylase
MIALPRIYPILDAKYFPNASGLIEAAEELAAAGATLLQYRNKYGSAREMLEQAQELKKRLGDWSEGRPFGMLRVGSRSPAALQSPPRKGVSVVPGGSWAPTASGAPYSVRLIMNDRADLCLAAGFDGVHVGQDDLSPEAVRRIVGSERWVGVSTHNAEQVREADLTQADYIAIGPVFSTSSKEKPDPVVGLDGVRRARELTGKPLVAIGGITRANAASVIEAGADSVAVISDLLREPRKSAEAFLSILG